MARPNVGDRFPFTIKAEASNTIHAVSPDLPSAGRSYLFAIDYQKMIEMGPLPVGGTYRIKTTISKIQTAGSHCYARVYKNGEPYGDELVSYTDLNVPKSLTQNLEFEAGDTIELWGWTESWFGYLNEFKVMSTLGIPVPFTWENP